MNIKHYYPESYKDNEIPFPHESGRKQRKANQTQNKPELLYDDEGNAYYSEENQKQEIKSATSEDAAYDTEDEIIENIDIKTKERFKKTKKLYDREQELLDAIDNDNEIPNRVKVAENHNEIKERFDSEENEKHKKYDKYKDFKGAEETKNYEQEDNDEITPTTDILVTEKIEENEAENQNLYYERKIAKTKSNDDRNIDYKQKQFHADKNPNRDRRHGKEKIGDFRKSNRAERQYTKRELAEVFKY